MDALADDELPAFEYRGYALGHIARHSVAHFARTDRIDQAPWVLPVYRDWLKSIVVVVDAVEHVLDVESPDVVVVFNGLFAPEWVVLEVAHRRNIRVVTWEVGFRPDTYFFRHERPTDQIDPSQWRLYKDRPLLERERLVITRYLGERSRGGGYLLTYFPNMKDSHAAICEEFGIDTSKKTFVLFPNITWDSTLFERDVGFHGMADWIRETISALAGDPAVQLVVRIHPAEVVIPGSGRDSVVDLIRSAFPELPPNVIIIPAGSGTSSYALMDLADCGLLYGSTTGIELGVRGVPVVVAGDVYYRGLGLTHDPATRAEYRDVLRRIIDGRIPRRDPDKAEQWLKYAYFGMFRAAIPLHQIRYRHVMEQPQLEIESTDELREGADPDLDVVCLGILEGAPFLASDPGEEPSEPGTPARATRAATGAAEC